MSRILLRAHQPARVRPSAGRVYARNLIGNNVGNLLFSYAVERQLSAEANQVTALPLDGRLPDVGWVHENFDHLVIPLANAFRLSYLEQLVPLTDFVQSLRIPVTVVGVGAQARLDGGRYARGRDEVDAAVARFVRAVLARGPSIGVRGEYSWEFVRKLGFGEDEVQIIGCPSMFLFGPELPAQRGTPGAGAGLERSARLSINVSPYVTAMGPIVQHNLERYPNLRYAAQDRDTLGLLLGHAYRGKGADDPGLPTSTDHPLLAPGRTFMAVNAPSWLAELATYEFSFGTRIHGNIAAILAGTPAMVLAHDSRTLELARYHELPFQRISELTEPAGSEAGALFDQADGSAMRRGHQARFDIYREFLSRHGLRTVFEPGANPDRFDREIAALPSVPVVRSGQPVHPGRRLAREAISRARRLGRRIVEQAPA